MARSFTLHWLAAAAAAGLLAQGASAGVAYSEAASGDLSSSGAAPTGVALALGVNTVLGSSGKDGLGVVDRDYFTITVDAGQQLTGLAVLPGTTVLGALSFIGVQAGTAVTVSPTGGSAAGLLGWTHYGSDDIGHDILPRIGTGFGASGFSGALGPGSYAFWVQDTGLGTSNYAFDLTLQAVPEPASALLLLTGLVAGVTWRRPRAAR
jgi:hypothetical protein